MFPSKCENEKRREPRKLAFELCMFCWTGLRILPPRCSRTCYVFIRSDRRSLDEFGLKVRSRRGRICITFERVLYLEARFERLTNFRAEGITRKGIDSVVVVVTLLRFRKVRGKTHFFLFDVVPRRSIPKSKRFFPPLTPPPSSSYLQRCP